MNPTLKQFAQIIRGAITGRCSVVERPATDTGLCREVLALDGDYFIVDAGKLLPLLDEKEALAHDNARLRLEVDTRKRREALAIQERDAARQHVATLETSMLLMRAFTDSTPPKPVAYAVRTHSGEVVSLSVPEPNWNQELLLALDALAPHEAPHVLVHLIEAPHASAPTADSTPLPVINAKATA